VRRHRTAFFCSEICNDFVNRSYRQRCVGQEAHTTAGRETGATGVYLPESRVSMAFW
jgi:hypothetical protein